MSLPSKKMMNSEEKDQYLIYMGQAKKVFALWKIETPAQTAILPILEQILIAKTLYPRIKEECKNSTSIPVSLRRREDKAHIRKVRDLMTAIQSVFMTWGISPTASPETIVSAINVAYLLRRIE